jgi:hypothetical protein
MYIPLMPPPGYDRDCMDPFNLPLRDHGSWIRHAKEVQMAGSEVAYKELSKEYGINGTSIFANFGSLSFPNSFPVDVMHLLENIMEALVKLWTGQSGLDDGEEEYLLQKKVWEAIRESTVGASNTLPATFRRRLDNIAVNRGYYTAEAWFIWTTLLSPALLQHQFKHDRYYRHFMKLIQLVTTCLEWEMSIEKVREIKQGFAEWVLEFEK